MATFDHFAYGSNMSTQRIRQRCPTAIVIGTGYVLRRQLRMHKIGEDGSAKADAFWTGDERDRIYGVIYRCDETDRVMLDRCETLGVGYVATPVDVVMLSLAETANVKGEEIRRVFLYEAIADMIDASLSPLSWYTAHILTGAAEHQLPQDYQAQLQRLRDLS